MTARDTQPVALRVGIVAALGAVVHVLVVAGLVDDQLETPIVAAVDAVAAVVAIVWARRAVTPNARVLAYTPTGDPRDGVAADAAHEPNGTPVVVGVEAEVDLDSGPMS